MHVRVYMRWKITQNEGRRVQKGPQKREEEGIKGLQIIYLLFPSSTLPRILCESFSL